MITTNVLIRNLENNVFLELKAIVHMDLHDVQILQQILDFCKEEWCWWEDRLEMGDQLKSGNGCQI